jgi:hypothetical protein
MLADVHGWFTEGFNTAALKSAKAFNGLNARCRPRTTDCLQPIPACHCQAFSSLRSPAAPDPASENFGSGPPTSEAII